MLRVPAMKSGTVRNGRAVRPAGFTAVATMFSAVMAMEAATLLVLLLVYRSNFCAWLYPGPGDAAQPSMIEDRGHAARESSSASLTARTA